MKKMESMDSNPWEEGYSQSSCLKQVLHSAQMQGFLKWVSIYDDRLCQIV